MKKKLSLSRAVKANCIDCIYDSKAGGTAIQQVTNCACTDCNMWEHRPLTSAKKEEHRLEMYNLMSKKEQISYLAKRAKKANSSSLVHK